MPRGEPTQPELSERICELLRQGLSQRDIAGQLGCSKATVGKHRVHDALPQAHKPRVAPNEFSVHPAVEAAKQELFAAFNTGNNIGAARQKLAASLEQYHPRNQRPAEQLEKPMSDDEKLYHVSPYKRIEIGAPITPRPKPDYGAHVPEPGYVSPVQADRIWGYLIQTARGTNQGAAPEPDLDLIAFAKSGGPP